MSNYAGTHIVHVLLLVPVQPALGLDQVFQVGSVCFVSFTNKLSVDKLDKAV